MRLRRPDDRRRDGGLAEQPGQRDLRPGDAPRAGHLADAVHDRPVGLLGPGVEGLAELVGSGPLRAPLLVPRPGQSPAGERAPGEHADPLGEAEADHLPLLLAIEQVVVVLHRDEPRPAVEVGQVERLAELPGEHRRGADVAGLARLHDVVQGLQRLLDRRLVVPAVDLVQVDVVGAEPPEARVDLRQDRLPRQAPAVRALPRREEHLGRDHHLVPPGEVAERPAEDLLARAVGVGVRGVEEVDPELQGAGEERPALLLAQRPGVGAPLRDRRRSCTRGRAATP